MKIAIVGGSGFVGTRLIDVLKNDYELLNIDKLSSLFYDDITVIGDVRDKGTMIKHLKGIELVVLLAAEHRDDVTPTTLYYDVNVGGISNVLEAMSINSVSRLFFTSSVAVYGLNKTNPSEEHFIDPFNHYGKSKWQAEQILKDWHMNNPNWNINIVRPTVIFGERNRGNVFNLLRQISGGKFLMIGSGRNKKSMAYVGNIVAFIKFCIEKKKEGYNIFNYIDKPDFTMNELVDNVGKVLNKYIPTVHIPYFIGMLGGICFDILAKITGKKLSISSVRVKKFCATTQFDATKVSSSEFKVPYTLEEGMTRTLKFEFIEKGADKDGITFKSE